VLSGCRGASAPIANRWPKRKAQEGLSLLYRVYIFGKSTRPDQVVRDKLTFDVHSRVELGSKRVELSRRAKPSVVGAPPSLSPSSLVVFS